MIELALFVFQFFLMIAMLSMLYKENVLYRFAQYSFVAVAAASFSLVAVDAVIKQAWTPLTLGNALMIVPIIAGIIILLNPVKKYYWISTYSLFFIMGVGTALAIRGAIPTSIIGQLNALFAWATITADPIRTISNVVGILFTILAFLYFFFHFVHRSKAGRGVQSIGRWTIMIWVGVGFAGMILLNMTILVYVVLWVFVSGPPPTIPLEVSYGAALLTFAITVLAAYFISKRFAKTKA